MSEAQTAGHRRNRRKQIVVNKKLQGRLIFATAWAPSLCLASTALLLGVFCTQLYDEATNADVDLPSVVPVFVTAVSFMLIATGYMLFNALRFSHRIAGPMYNLEQTLKRFREGAPGARVVLRKYDYLQEIQDPVNSFLDWVEEELPGREDQASGEPEAHAQAQDTVGAGTETR